MSFRRCFFFSFKHFEICTKTGVCRHFYCTIIYFSNSAIEALQILDETCGYYALSETACRDWIKRLKNNGFDVENKEHSAASNKFEDEKTTVSKPLKVNSFETFENNMNDSKAMGGVRVEAKVSFHRWLLQRQKIFCIVS